MKTGTLASNLSTAILVTCALVVTGLVVRRELLASSTQSSTERGYVSDWQALAALGHWSGESDAPVVIAEFSDAQCVYCRDSHNDLEQIQAMYGDKVAVSHLHFPLPARPQSWDAANAMECAADQGPYFPRYKKLTHNRPALVRDSLWDSLAVLAEIPDLETFHDCVATQRHIEKVVRQVEAGQGIGVSATPTTIINGIKYPARLRIEGLQFLIDSLLSQQPVRVTAAQQDDVPAI